MKPERMQHKVLITEFIDESALLAFPPDVQVTYAPKLVDQRSELLEQVQDYDALIVRNRTQVDRELLQQAARLKAIGRLGVGLDNIDLKHCDDLNIQVLPATGANTRSVAEYVIAATLLTTRRAFASTPEILAGAWPRPALGQGGEIEGRTLGLIGFGAIAQATAQLSRALGMRVIAYDPFQTEASFVAAAVESCSLESCLSRSDVLSLHLPLTADTRSLINAQRISLMRKGAILINTARGEVVELEPLVKALNSGHLSAAVIDVFDSEPPSPVLLKKLHGCENLTLTPHIAGVTAEANQRVSLMTVQNVVHALKEAKTDG